jgi:hypothetical protein
MGLNSCGLSHDSQAYYFEAIALPFGSVSSVLAFNRAVVLSKIFKLVIYNELL